ncbi:DUF6252 family protein [Hymenobacter properus]|uniref:Uncharacterized protein n=1 Tax=Hymenobacter properus TaxID=2791026 RepID=A0A931BJ85_9BACT|nr:DUF6252 family protein [Hymenobacter properus]MBF9142357.1 hypothetical protein [Hymenobacter properus]MBR7721164.1 hypothetical protein [Microvirga sp. SRT04]
MKTLVMCLSAGWLMLAGCSKKSDDAVPSSPSNPSGPGTVSTLSANVTGYPAVAYTSPTGALNTAVSAARIASNDPNYGPYLLRIVANVNGQGVALTLAKFTGAGTYVLKSDYSATLATNNTGTYADGTSTYRSAYMPGSGVSQGQVVVTGYDETTRRVKGTFSFTGSDVNPQNLSASHTRQLTDGAFDVSVTL